MILIMVFYKDKRGLKCIPCRTLREGKTYANNLLKKGMTGIKVCKVDEEILYIPSIDNI